MYKCIQTHDFASFQHTDAFLLTFPSCSRRRASMRKGGFRITPGDYCPLSVIDCQERRLSIDHRRGVLTKCQTKASTVPFLAPKIRLGGFRGPSQAICKIHIDTNSLQALSSRHNLKAASFPYDIRIPTRHTLWNLPIY